MTYKPQQQPQPENQPVPLGRRLPPEMVARQVGDNPYAGAGGGKDVPQPQPPPAPPLPPDTPAPEMPESESEFQGRVIALAYAKGWRIYHTYDSRRSVAGFPDLLMLHPQHGQIVAELKTEKGKLTPQQANWLLAFEAAGLAAAIWRPADLASGLIGRWLAGAFANAGAGAGQPQQQDVQPDTPAPAPAPCWNCGAAPRVTAASMLCGSCGGGGVA